MGIPKTFAHLAVTFDPQHDPLHELDCLQPPAAHKETLCVGCNSHHRRFEWETDN